MAGWMILGNRYPFTYVEPPSSLTLMRTDHSERITYVPESIVRCRDCKYCHPRPYYKEQMWCGLSGIDMTKTDGFCSWGKRKDGE